jgi:hypothetical protein
MLAALLTAYLVFSGNGGFAAKMFGKDTQALVRAVVSDPARAAAAVQTLKQGDKELKAIAKQFEKIAKGFTKADEAQSAGLDELTPFMQQASEQRRVTRKKSLDRLFELRQTLTKEEWSKVFATLK